VLERRFVCSLDDLPPGAMKLVDVGKFGVGVYNVGGSLHAIVNYCSHEGAPLCEGLIGGTNEPAPDEPDEDEDEHALASSAAARGRATARTPERVRMTLYSQMGGSADWARGVENDYRYDNHFH